MKSQSVDPYCYPGTDVLRNLNDIRDGADLAAFEAATVAVNLYQLTEEPLQGPFNLDRLLTTHRRIFDGVYPWAGQLRQNTGMMKKQRADGSGVVYADSAFIASALATLFGKLSEERFLHRLSPRQFSDRAAFFYGEFDTIHPFREGNSRTLRKFFVDLAHAAGYKLDWTAASATDDDRQRIFQARDLAVMHGDCSLLARIIAQNLRSSTSP